MTAGHQPRAADPVSRRQFLRGASALALGGTLGVSLSGCAGSALSGLSISHRQAGSLDFWNLFGGGDGVRMQAMLDVFRKDNPDIGLSAVTLPGATRTTRSCRWPPSAGSRRTSPSPT